MTQNPPLETIGSERKHNLAKLMLNQKIEFLNETDKKLFFEQYKLTVESAHKIEERRQNTNNIFLAMNSILLTYLMQYNILSNISLNTFIAVFMFTIIGIIIASQWLNCSYSYKKLNFTNYAIIKEFETYLPTSCFSIRAELEANQAKSSKANVILEKENFVPKTFFWIYIIYFAGAGVFFVYNFTLLL